MARYKVLVSRAPDGDRREFASQLRGMPPALDRARLIELVGRPVIGPVVVAEGYRAEELEVIQGRLASLGFGAFVYEQPGWFESLKEQWRGERAGPGWHVRFVEWLRALRRPLRPARTAGEVRYRAGGDRAKVLAICAGVVVALAGGAYGLSILLDGGGSDAPGTRRDEKQIGEDGGPTAAATGGERRVSMRVAGGGAGGEADRKQSGQARDGGGGSGGPGKALAASGDATVESDANAATGQEDDARRGRAARMAAIVVGLVLGLAAARGLVAAVRAMSPAWQRRLLLGVGVPIGVLAGAAGVYGIVTGAEEAEQEVSAPWGGGASQAAPASPLAGLRVTESASPGAPGAAPPATGGKGSFASFVRGLPANPPAPAPTAIASPVKPFGQMLARFRLQRQVAAAGRDAPGGPGAAPAGRQEGAGAQVPASTPAAAPTTANPTTSTTTTTSTSTSTSTNAAPKVDRAAPEAEADGPFRAAKVPFPAGAIGFGAGLLAGLVVFVPRRARPGAGALAGAATREW